MDLFVRCRSRDLVSEIFVIPHFEKSVITTSTVFLGLTYFLQYIDVVIVILFNFVFGRSLGDAIFVFFFISLRLR